MAGTRIVVGIDGSAGSLAALSFAITEAGFRDATVEAVMAWRFPAILTEQLIPPDFDPEGWARRALESTLEAVPHQGVTVEGRVAEGHPAGVLVDAAEGAELLVVGNRGHGGFTGVLLGSVSQHCVAHSPCPVVVVPHPHE